VAHTNDIDWLVLQADEAHAARVVALFQRADVPCYCQYYQFDGDHRQWQDRCANHRDSNRQGLAADLTSGRILGVAAVCGDGEVIGWARVAPAAQLGKLYQNRLYRSLDVLQQGPREHTFAVSCFLVDPNFRRQGVARSLLKAAIALAKEQGALALEGFPRGADDVSDGEQWLGPLDLYEELGFVRVVDFAPYPVYRLQLVDALQGELSQLGD
jgi:GNAT superfamily N-acetyltransferase